MNTKKNNSKKMIALLLVLMLLLGGVIGGTIAYLIAEPVSNTNTFVAGGIGVLEIKDEIGEVTVTPGKNITETIKVSFKNYNVGAYVFLEIDETGWTVRENEGTYEYTLGTGVTWTLDGWTMLKNGVYYKTVAYNDGDQTWTVVDGIEVSKEISMSDIADHAGQLKITAYAIQSDELTAEDAWEELQ